MRFGIVTKISILAVLVVIITAGTVGIAVYEGGHDILVDRELEALRNEVHLHTAHLQTDISALREDVLFLSMTSPILGIIRARQSGGVEPTDGSTEQQWRDRLATIFEAFLRAKPRYQQLRFFGAADGGREIVRVDRVGDELVRTPREKLQQKAGRPYLQKTLQARPG